MWKKVVCFTINHTGGANLTGPVSCMHAAYENNPFFQLWVECVNRKSEDALEKG